MRMAEVQAKLKEGNSSFASTNTDYKALVSGQKPNATIVACSDSRVSPEIVHGARLGEIFVIRTAGQAMDDAAIASIEYSIVHLGVESVIVEGHTGCGAVTAAMEALGGKMPKEATLFRVVKALSADIPKDADLDTAVWTNARARARELLRKSDCVSSYVMGGRLDLGVAVFDMRSGSVSDIELIRS